MRARDGQKRNAEHFQSQMEGRQVSGVSLTNPDFTLDWMRERRAALAKKRVDTASIFLQLSKYEEARSTPGYPLGGPLCRARRRAAAGHSALAAFRFSHRNDRRRSAGRVGDSGVHTFASPGKTETSGAGQCTARRNIFVVFREYRGLARSAWLPL